MMRIYIAGEQSVCSRHWNRLRIMVTFPSVGEVVKSLNSEVILGYVWINIGFILYDDKDAPESQKHHSSLPLLCADK